MTELMMNLVHGGVPQMGEDAEGAVVVRVEGSVVDHAVVVTLQRWKNVRILRIYPCYFFRTVLIFWLYMRKQTKTPCYYHCSTSNMIKLLSY